MLFANEVKELSLNTYWALFGVGIGSLILGIAATAFFVIFKQTKKIEKDNFKTITGKYKIFRFWQYYAIIILMLVGYVCALIFISIGLEGIIRN